MADVNRIIADYKEALRQKELQRQAELEKEKQKRVLNAEAIENCIKKVIEPVFESVKAQIIENGFPCEVEFVSKKDHSFRENKTFAIGIKIVTQSRADNFPGSKSHLQYEGKFDAQEIRRTEWIANSGAQPKESPPIALSRVDSDMIDKDLESFLREIFRA